MCIVDDRDSGRRRKESMPLLAVNDKREDTEMMIDDDTVGGGDSMTDCSFMVMPPGRPCRGLYSPAVGQYDAERLYSSR
jgi:hypothetical protein